MAAKHAATNFLGLEIRRPVVATAVDRAVRAGLPNCAFLACNANVDFDRIMADAAAAGATLGTVSIQFPDPHFKARHHKRRVLQPALVAAIQRWLRPGGSLFMQGDVLPVVEEMRAIVREHGDLLEDAQMDAEDWMRGPDANPTGVATEREVATYAKGGGEDVYRCLFIRCP